MYRFLKVDFVTGEGLDACFSYFDVDKKRHLDAVVNCVAISQPVACEKDPERARLINIPLKLLDALNTYLEKTPSFPAPLLIFLSTDQVYDGRQSFSKESDTANPINEYGKSKLEAERKIQSQWAHNHIILRSSLIYGKEPPVAAVDRSLFLQFIDEKLASGQETSFFNDEWRSAVYVEDIIRVCKLFIEASVAFNTKTEAAGPEKIATTSTRGFHVFNMGGPERLSRVDMAKLVAEVRGYDAKHIVEVPSASVSRGVASPSDISIDVSKLEKKTTEMLMTLGMARGVCVGTEEFKFTKFKDALHDIFN
jgi:dTDP-4-dehydrorhamnose reductase